jgi:hypothetical protein
LKNILAGDPLGTLLLMLANHQFTIAGIFGALTREVQQSQF